MNAKRMKLSECCPPSTPIVSSSGSPGSDEDLLRSGRLSGNTSIGDAAIPKRDNPSSNVGHFKGSSESDGSKPQQTSSLSNGRDEHSAGCVVGRCIATAAVNLSSNMDFGSLCASSDKTSLVISEPSLIKGCLDADILIIDSIASSSRNEVVQECANIEFLWEPIAVLSEEITREIPLVEVYVGTIVDQKQTSRLIRELNAVCPVPAIQHLKRVHRDKVILQLAGGGSAEQCVDDLMALGLDVTGLSGCPTKQFVPQKPAKTRRQFEKCLAYWPCNFHEDKELTRLLRHDFYTKEEKLKQAGYLKTCLEAAERSWDIGGIGTAAVIVDPRKDAIVSVGLDQRNTHPLKHAAMVVIDQVATAQGGGVWEAKDGGNPQSRKSPDPDDAEDALGTAAVESVTDEIVEDGTEDKDVADGNEEVIDGRGSSSRSLGVTESGKSLGETRVCNAEDAFKDGAVIPDLDGPYLCTGYDVYLSREPCIMCAMALLHSRVSNIFYGFSCPHGALGSKIRLHTIKGLNHNFAVFKGNLNDLNIHNPESVRSGS